MEAMTVHWQKRSDYPFLRALSQSRHTLPNGLLEQLRKKQRNPFF